MHDDSFTPLLRYLTVVDDVAARFTHLPLEHVIRALRRELKDFGVNDETVLRFARRISSGSLPG